MFILVIQWLFQRLYTWRDEGKEGENTKGLVFIKHIIWGRFLKTWIAKQEK